MEIFSYKEKDLSHLDSCISECDTEVYRIIHLQIIANRLFNAFNDVAKVTKSYIPVINTSTRIHVPKEHEEIDNNVPRLKHNRLIGSNDDAPRIKSERIISILF